MYHSLVPVEIDFPNSPPLRFKYQEFLRQKVRLLVGRVPMVID